MGKEKILKKTVPLLVMLLVGILTTAYGYARVRAEYGFRIYENSSDQFTDSIKEGDRYTTAWIAPEDMRFDSIALLFVDYGNQNQSGRLLVTLTDETTGQTLGSGELAAADITEWIWQSVPMNGETVREGDTLALTVTATDFTGEETLSFVRAKDGEHLALSAGTNAWDSFQRLQLIFSILLLGLIVLAWFMLYVWSVRLEYLFLIVFSVLGMMFNLLVPSELGPDEGAVHLNTTYKIAERLSGWDAVSDTVSLITEEEAHNGLTTEAPGHDYYVSYFGWLSSRTGEQGLAEHAYYGAHENPNITYTPAAIGITIARKLHLSAAGIITLGRVCSFIPILLLLFYAILSIPFGKELLFAVALLPTMVQESTTINADGIDIAMSLALTAGVLRLLYDETKRKSRFLDYGIIAGTSLILSRCKYGALVPMCLLVLLIFWKYKKELIRRSDPERMIVALASLALPVLGIVFGFLPLFTTTVDAYGPTLWAEHYTFSDILRDPLDIAFLLGNTIYKKLDFYLLSMAGTWLGWLNIVIPEYLSIVMLFIVLLSVPTERSYIQKEGERVFATKWRLSFGTKAYMALLAFLGIAFAVGGMLVGWTNKGAEVIDGVQGRYFLPFLPMILLAVRPVRLATPEDGSVQRTAVMAAVFMQILIVTALFVRAQ